MCPIIVKKVSQEQNVQKAWGFFFMWLLFSLFSSWWQLRIFLFYCRRSEAVGWQWRFSSFCPEMPLAICRSEVCFLQVLCIYCVPLLQKRVAFPAPYWGYGDVCERGCCSSTCLLKQFSRRPSSRIRFSRFVQVSQKLSNSEQLQEVCLLCPFRSWSCSFCFITMWDWDAA